MRIDVDDGASVFLVTSGPSAPIAVNGTIVSHDGDTLVIRVDRPIEQQDAASAPLPAVHDRREIQRYPTWLDAIVYSPAFPSGQPAVITDLSSVGAAIEIDDWAADAFFRIEFEIQEEAVHVECESVHEETTWRGTLVHARFVLVTSGQQEILDALVASLRNVFGQAQEQLATQRLAPSGR